MFCLASRENRDDANTGSCNSCSHACRHTWADEELEEHSVLVERDRTPALLPSRTHRFRPGIFPPQFRRNTIRNAFFRDR